MLSTSAAKPKLEHILVRAGSRSSATWSGISINTQPLIAYLLLDVDSILADCQHGFWNQLSYETQLMQFVHDIISSMDIAVHRRHNQTYLIIMDFAKVFDKVPHRKLR